MGDACPEPRKRPCLPAHLIQALVLLETLAQARQHEVMVPQALLAGLRSATLSESRPVLPREVDSGIAYTLSCGLRRGATVFMRLPKRYVAQNQLRAPALDKLKDTYTKNAPSITVQNSQQ